MGRPQFEAVVASAPREYLEKVVLLSSTPIAGGGQFELNKIYAPPGFVGELVGLRIDLPIVPAATSGYHAFYIGYDTGDPQNIDLIKGEANYGDPVYFRHGFVFQASKLKYPTSEDGAIALMSNIKFDDTVALSINYGNFTDKSATAERRIQFTVKYRQVAG